ncbi:MAG: hypothetical protein HQL14_05975 [Candidatus Omnitrophica bacterium]|nr:hypothetical protein [Candidatus Omnitrophota bacterium]
MISINNAQLLKDKEILDEINRYKWLKSEKEGADIGLERACREWINTCSKQYFNRHPGKSTILWLKSQPFYSVLNKEIKI